MALHPTPCEICEQIAQIQNQTFPRLILELPSGYAVLGPSQFFRGYTLFLAKTPASDLEDLPWPQRLEFLRDLAIVSQAVFEVCRPDKMNVESLGNVVPHLHFHLFPRYATEPEPQKPVWLVMPDETDAPQWEFSSEKHGDLILQLRAKIREIESSHPRGENS